MMLALSHQERVHLSPRGCMVLDAYAQGIFPMADPDTGTVGWYLPEWRGILPLEEFHVSRRLRRTIRRAPYQIRIDTAFRAVMEACAAPGPGRESTWISDELVELFCELHAGGFAHSVETWHNGRLVGGLYGVAVRGLFAGESMFSRARDASKIALAHLANRLRTAGYSLLDTQFYTPHLGQFGAIEIHRDAYARLLAEALSVRPDPGAFGA